MKVRAGCRTPKKSLFVPFGKPHLGNLLPESAPSLYPNPRTSHVSVRVQAVQSPLPRQKKYQTLEEEATSRPTGREVGSMTLRVS